ncbi:MAG: TolC family protein [Magnetococcales bacterium]|nr:TolC family protein [Magnetococcales bacterium]NGZ27338.1 TolC family protein [Magnetococcales bacterium]
MSHTQPTLSRKLSVLVTLLALAAAGSADATETGKQKVDLAAKGLALDFIPDGKDRANYKIVQETLGENSDGAWGHLRDRGVVYLSPQEAMVGVLRNNLTVKVSSAEAAKAALAVQQAEAVFDPTFLVDFGRTYSTTYNRKGFGPVYQKNFRATPTNGQPYLDIMTAGDPEPEINRIGYLGPQASGTVNKEYYFSKAPKKGPSESYSGTLGVTQQLPWGSQLRLTHGINYRLVDYDELGHSYDMPYASSIALNILVPLPGMKNFGKFAPQEVATQQAKLTRDRGDLNLRLVIEQSLLEADLAYWDLVQSLENLLAAIEIRRSSQEQAKNADKMLDLGRTTQYGKNQRDAEFARTKVAEEQARDNLINASYRMSLALESGKDVSNAPILLPAGYHDRLAAEMAIDGKVAHQKAMERRMELNLAAVDYASNVLNLRYRENQALPDVSFTGNFSQGQSNKEYGYGSYPSSLSHLHKPDTRSYGTGMAFVRPIGNRAANAGVEQARGYLQQSDLSRESTEKDIAKEVEDALASVSSARLRKKAAKRTEELAALTLNKLRSRSESVGDVNELELTLKQRELLQARTASILAQMDAKRAETRLLMAQGILAETMGDKTAIDEFDRYRIQLLADSKATPFFSSFSFGKSDTAKP